RGHLPLHLRTDSASFLSERQRIVSFSAFQANSAWPRFVSAHIASRDPPVTLPPLHQASGVELLAGEAKPVVSRRTDSGRFSNDRVAASAGGRCVRCGLAEGRFVQKWGRPTRATDVTCVPMSMGPTLAAPSIRISFRR